MANICNNRVKVYFVGKEPYKDAQQFVKEFLEDFHDTDYMYPDSEEFQTEDQFEDFCDNIEIDFDSSRSTPTEKLEEYSNKYNCTILGVSYEWGNCYVNSFDINCVEEEIEQSPSIEVLNEVFDEFGKIFSESPSIEKIEDNNRNLRYRDDGGTD